MKRRRILIRILFLYLLIPAILFVIPPESLESLPQICLYRNIFGRECPGCGMTRAFLYVLHLRFADAFTRNRLIIIIFPLTVYLFFKNLILDVNQLKRGWQSNLT